MSELEGCLEHWRSEGSLHSTGSFTLSWEHALEKLGEYSSSRSERYLVLLVSAAVAWRPRQIEISDDGFELRLQAVRAQVPVDDLEVGPALPSGPQWDLLMAAKQALRFGAVLVEVRYHGETGNFAWSLGRKELTAGDLPQTPGLTVRVVRREERWGHKLYRLFSNFRGYAGMAPECREVDKQCEHSPVPITVNDQPVNRPYIPVYSPCQVVVGPVHPSQASIEFITERESPGPWRGVLSFVSGPLLFVVNGVTFPAPREVSRLSGIIWSEELSLDASREQVVQDAVFQNLLSRIEDYRARILSEWHRGLTGHPPDLHQHLCLQLTDCFAGGHYSVEEMKEILGGPAVRVLYPEPTDLLSFLKRCQRAFARDPSRLQCVCGIAHDLLRKQNPQDWEPQLLEELWLNFRNQLDLLSANVDIAQFREVLSADLSYLLRVRKSRHKRAYRAFLQKASRELDSFLKECGHSLKPEDRLWALEGLYAISKSRPLTSLREYLTMVKRAVLRADKRPLALDGYRVARFVLTNDEHPPTSAVEALAFFLARTEAAATPFNANLQWLLLEIERWRRHPQWKALRRPLREQLSTPMAQWKTQGRKQHKLKDQIAEFLSS